MPDCRCAGTGIMAVSERRGSVIHSVVCSCAAGKFVAARSYGAVAVGEVLPRR
jgi:hypothetical protein